MNTDSKKAETKQCTIPSVSGSNDRKYTKDDVMEAIKILGVTLWRESLKLKNAYLKDL